MSRSKSMRMVLILRHSRGLIVSNPFVHFDPGGSVRCYCEGLLHPGRVAVDRPAHGVAEGADVVVVLDLRGVLLPG